jgi:methyltransferase family protein
MQWYRRAFGAKSETTNWSSLMAYGIGLLREIESLLDNGIIPMPQPGDRVVELGSQMLNVGTPADAVISLIKKVKPDFDGSEIANGLPVNSFGVVYACEMWRRSGLDYRSYDITEAPFSSVFDLNFQAVPEEDRQSATIVTNIGTTEHIANQLNAFRTIHDLLKVGGVALHSVPFTGMLNHCLINYHPKFFFSLVVNNRYKLRYVQFHGPVRHEALGVGNTVFDGDYLPASHNILGSEAWSETPLITGVMDLVIERVLPDEFVPPVDFAKGYYGDFGAGDLAKLVGATTLPHSAWAEAYRKSTTPSQTERP